ncbi:MAG TPA: class I SAM-dependent methyltransferase [Chitinophagaceae bacterium]
MEPVKEFLNYKFYPVTACNMCGSGPADHKVIGQRLNQSTGMKPKRKHGIAVSVLKCKKCGLIFPDPMPVPNDIQDHYGIPPESYWKDEYFTWNEGYFEGEIEKLKQLMTITPGMKALDIGAGLGKCMLSLQNAGFDVYGMEPSVPFYERAINRMNISKEKLKLGMLEDIEYPEKEFDFITFGAVLEHLYNPADNIKRALKWLKPGGLIHIEVPSSRHLVARLINRYYRLTGTNYVTNISPMHSPFHLHEFDLRSFKRLGEKNDFEIIKADYFVCEIMFFPRIIKPLLAKYMQLTNTGMQLVVWLKRK